MLYMETTQVNLRLPKRLVYDLEFISQHLNVNKSEWLKVKIAEMISNERIKILEEFDNRYIKGFISEKQYKEEIGMVPSESLKENRKFFLKQKSNDVTGARNYLNLMMKEANSREEKLINSLIKRTALKGTNLNQSESEDDLSMEEAMGK